MKEDPMTEDDVTTILIVDDHPLFRDGLAGILAGDPTVEVVGAASDGAEAVQLAAGLQPDVVLMDLHLPNLNGIDATRMIVEASPHIAVLVVTMFDDDASVFSAMRAGARGYFLKGATGPEILRAVHAAGSGEAIFSPSVARQLIAYFKTGSANHASVSVPFPELTQREREVLHLIASGKSNPEITRELVLSPKTVRNHISNIFSKLQVADRSQAIVRAREAGLGRREPRP
jgi:DNA-binding NarL/FixJ family response regulator